MTEQAHPLDSHPSTTSSPTANGSPPVTTPPGGVQQAAQAGSDGWRFVAIFSSCAMFVFAAIQTFCIYRQTGILEEQARISREQVTLARPALSPKFEFVGTDGGFNVANRGERVIELKGFCIPYIVVKAPNGHTKKIEVAGYYTSRDGFTLRSKTLFFWLTDKQFWFTELLKGSPRVHDIYQYFHIEYTNVAGERRTERYTMDWDGADIRSVEAPPRMDGKVDVQEWLIEDRKGYAGANAALRKEIDRIAGPQAK